MIVQGKCVFLDKNAKTRDLAFHFVFKNSKIHNLKSKVHAYFFKKKKLKT